MWVPRCLQPAKNAAAKRLARAWTRSVVLATPIARDPCWQYTFAFAETCINLDRLGIRFVSQFVIGSSNLPRARNELCARFLATGFSDLIFIDDDMGWRAEDVVRLLASDKPLIGGVGRKRVDKPNSDPNVWCVGFQPSAGRALEQDAFGAIKVDRVGTGFLKISRVVFEKMIDAHPDWKREGNCEMGEKVRSFYHQFFRFDPDDPSEMGEDFVFCERARALGFEIWADPAITLSHVGSKAYTGSVAEILQARPKDEGAE